MDAKLPLDATIINALHQRAQEWLRVRKLPTGTPRVYGGYGSQQPCTLCGVVIDRAQVEYEIVSTDHDSVENGPSNLIRLHLLCHAIYEYERVRAVANNRASDGGEVER